MPPLCAARLGRLVPAPQKDHPPRPEAREPAPRPPPQCDHHRFWLCEQFQRPQQRPDGHELRQPVLRGARARRAGRHVRRRGRRRVVLRRDPVRHARRLPAVRRRPREPRRRQYQYAVQVHYGHPSLLPRLYHRRAALPAPAHARARPREARDARRGHGPPVARAVPRPLPLLRRGARERRCRAAGAEAPGVPRPDGPAVQERHAAVAIPPCRAGA